MSLPPLLRTCSRIVSPVILRRRAPSANGYHGPAFAYRMSSSTKDPSAAKSKASEQSKASSKPPKGNVKTATPKQDAAPQEVEKGDTYKAGDSFFSYGPFSYYDIENQMQPKRIPQPSSQKASP